MDEDPKFNHDTHAAVVGANQTLIIKQTIVTKIYKSLVRPILVYGMFFAMTINKTDQNAVESVQRQTTKCINNLKDKGYRYQLQNLKLPTLTYHQCRGNMIMT